MRYLAITATDIFQVCYCRCSKVEFTFGLIEVHDSLNSNLKTNCFILVTLVLFRFELVGRELLLVVT